MTEDDRAFLLQLLRFELENVEWHDDYVDHMHGKGTCHYCHLERAISIVEACWPVPPRPDGPTTIGAPVTVTITPAPLAND